MANVTATINVQINAANAAAQLTALQGKVAAMNKGMLAATAGGVMAQEKAIRRMGNVLSGSGMFTTGIRNVHTELGRMHQEFDKGSTTLQKYRQNSQAWGKDHSAVNRMAADRVRMLQSQYVALGKEMNGVQQAMQIKPDRMMREFGADTEYAHQRAVLFRRNLQMGSTAMVNWGKNTQWAGRQMMVGMGIPIAIAAAGAIKAFNDIETASIAFKRVYGDTTTSVAEKSQMLAKMQKTVGTEMMKYGIAMSDTLDVSAKAAATGAQGADLIAATRETMRLATLGNMDYNKALEATIAMQTAFNINSKDMAKTTDFLNAVENQTILRMEDMALAVPRVAPVIKGLGGNVEDLAIMMTALRQGGVSAEQGANALKSGLGSLLNPTGAAIEQFDGLGVNLKKIVDTNKGDLIGTIQGLGKALDGLTKYDRQRALESLFGKYQYARMGALLKNINSKAVKETMKMAKASPGELAKMSQAELNQISDSPMIKLKKSVEELKAAAAPLGALFSDIAAKVISLATPVVKFFADNDMAKWGLVATAGFAALAGVITMVVGVFANFTGSMVKAGMSLKTFFRAITGQRSLAYLTTDELQASAAANSLATSAERAAGGMMAEAKAAQLLTSQLEALIAAQNGAAATSRRSAVPVTPTSSTTPGGRPSVAVPGALPAGLPPSTLSAEAFKSGYDRAHAARPVTYTSADPVYQQMKTYYEKYYSNKDKYPDGIPNTDHGRILKDMQAGKPITGYNAEAFLMREDLNRSMDSNGASISDVRADAKALSGNTVAPYFQNLAKAMGHTSAAAQQAFNADPKIREIAGRLSSAYINALATADAPDGRMTGEMYQRITAPVLEQARAELRALSPEHAAGVDAMQRPGFVSSESQRARTTVAQQATGSVTWGKSGDLPKTIQNTGFGDMGIQPIPQVSLQEQSQSQERAVRAQQKVDITQDNIDKRRAKVLEQRARRLAGELTGIRKMEERAAAALNEPLPARVDNDRGVKPTGSSRYQTALAAERSKYGMRGMGMMGAGMLASTAFMGMEMAGKEVPAAATFAANGLMGVGMAEQMLPETMGRVSAGLATVAGALGPWGVAIGAAVAAIGGAALFWRKFNIDARERGSQYGKAIADATYYAQEVASAYGNTSYVVEQQLKDDNTTKEEVDTSTQFLNSDAGKQWLNNNSKLMMKFGPAMASSSLATQVAGWVVQGAMTGENVQALIAAMNIQSPGSGVALEGSLTGLLGKGFNAYNPAKVANDMLSIQGQNSEAAIKTMMQQRDAATGATAADWFSGLMKLGPAGFPSKIKDFFGTVADEGLGEAAKGMLPLADPVGKEFDQRSKTQELTAATAEVWNSQLKTAFSNRMAIEARLNQMIAERDSLARRKKAGTATQQELQDLKGLDQQITRTQKSSKAFNDNIAASFAQLKGMNNLGDNTWYAAQLDATRNAGKKDTSGLTTWAANAIDNEKVNERFDRGQANNALSALRTGVITPAAVMNLTDFGNQMQRLPSIMEKLPAGKLQDFSTQIGNMTSTQARTALTDFGGRFIKAATAAKLSGKEAKDAAIALGAKPQQAKQVSINVRANKIKDPTAGLKDKNISVKALTGPAESRLQKLKKLAEEATGKNMKIDAKSNADAVIKKLRTMIKTAQAADGQGVDVDTDTNAPETESKLSTLGTVISNVAGAGLIPINATDNATPVASNALNILKDVDDLNPNPAIAVTSNAVAVAAITTSALAAIPDEEVVVRVTKQGAVATGGLFNYATGGVHKGPGKVSGPGGPTDDKVNARLSDGEFVIRASSVDKYGTGFLNAVNRGAYEKQAYAKGTPFGKTKTPNAPKDNEGKSRQVAFMNEWRNVMYEASNFVKEFKKMGKIIEHGRGVLGQRFKDMDYEFGRWIMDNYSPRQIKKMFKGKEGGAKQLAKQYRAEQKLAYRDEVRQQSVTVRNAKLKNQLLIEQGMFGKDDAGANAVSGMSDEQLQMYGRLKGKKKTAFVDNIVQGARIQEQQTKMTEAISRKKDIAKQYGGATGATLLKVASGQGMSMVEMQQAADALGVSIDDIAQQIDDGDLPINFKELAANAKLASKAMEVLSMTQADKNSQLISNRQSMMSTYQDVAGARARSAIQTKYGKSQSVLEAEGAVSDAKNAIDQARIDDINEKYSKQLEIFDQISQQQQAIANLERGRLNVASALSSGDIAAAASAAQQQRSETASFMQSQMRTQLENQQKAQTSVLQDQINERMRATRDIQNQIALEIANQNLLVAPMIGDLQSQSDQLMMQPDYITVANQAYEDQNALLKQNNAELAATIANLATVANIPAPTIEASVPTPTATGGSNKNNKGKDMSGKDKPGKNKKGKGRAFGGWVPGVGNRDNVPLLATPGEFVMRKAAAARFGPTLQAMNSGALKGTESSSGGVRIDNIIFNINGANLNEKEIADIAVRRMQSLDSGTIKGGRF